MSDKEAAKMVRDAVERLNDALSLAYGLGLHVTVDVSSIDVRSCDTNSYPLTMSVVVASQVMRPVLP